MPFICGDPEVWDECSKEFGPEEMEQMEWKRPSGGFDYHPCTECFSPEELGPIAQLMLEVLIAVGVTGFRVRYDGGGDEGFIYPEAFLVGHEKRDVKELLQQVASTELSSRLLEAARREDRIELYPDTPPAEPPPSEFGDEETWEVYAGASPFEVTENAMYCLGGMLAGKILGPGFGVGDPLYGALTADFVTGEILDDPEAVKPQEW